MKGMVLLMKRVVCKFPISLIDELIRDGEIGVDARGHLRGFDCLVTRLYRAQKENKENKRGGSQ